MSIEDRLRKVETIKDRTFHNRIKSLSDEDLQKLAGKGDDSDCYGKWLKTLTDDEIEIIADGKPGANSLQEQFNEYKKQNQEN